MTDIHTPLNKIEEIYEKKLGYSENFMCCSLKVTSQFISGFIILNSFMFYLQTIARWGAPCFLWWKYTSTAITFIIGHLTRLIGIPIGIYSCISARKNEEKGMRLLFHYLLFLTFICTIDLIVCVFEVHDVCNSEEMIKWHQCAHQWGKQSYSCINSFNHKCNATLHFNSQKEDKKICLESHCNYVDNENKIKPDCCHHSMWDDSQSPCSMDSIIRPEEFDTTWCEQFSDMYDIGLGLITSVVLVGFSYIINSYRIMLKDPLFTDNPMNEIDD